MERLFTVEFGPSRSKRFGKALAEARSGARECTEVEPGRYRARFLLGKDSAAYAALASLLERVRHWRATEVCEGDEATTVRPYAGRSPSLAIRIGTRAPRSSLCTPQGRRPRHPLHVHLVDEGTKVGVAEPNMPAHAISSDGRRASRRG